MGRFQKTVLAETGIERRASGYYTTPAFVADFLAHATRRYLPQATSVFDPCIGSGALVIPFVDRGLRAAGMDVANYGVPGGVAFEQADFLQRFATRSRTAFAESLRAHDVFVANPPYNCHEAGYIRDNRDLLRAAFGDVGTHNTYSMFLAALIELAKPGALIAFIALDSFLTSRTHRPLRRAILRQCAVHELLLCPTALFRDQGADVRTCIMILQKDRRHQGAVSVARRALDVADFRRTLRERNFERRALSEIVLDGANDAQEFVVSMNGELRQLFESQRIRDRFPCVTGISTGADADYLSPVRSSRFGIPFYKNPASRKFYAPPNAYLISDFLDVAKRKPNFMVRNRKYLYREGITCSSMGVAFGACHLPAGATYGVNANLIPEAADLWWLLAFLNSHLATYFVRGVLNRSNMVTSGYVARIPLPALGSGARKRLSALASAATAARVTAPQSQPFLAELNALLAAELGLSRSTVDFLADFSRNVTKAS